MVPKIHPATRAVDRDDPMTLHATPVAGDPDAMIASLLGEFAGMGWDIEQFLLLFRDPSYPMLHGLWRSIGEAELRARLDALGRRYGLHRLRVTVWEAPEEPESQLVQIGPMGPRGGHHADRH
jgi:hypothetical protein